MTSWDSNVFQEINACKKDDWKNYEKNLQSPLTNPERFTTIYVYLINTDGQGRLGWYYNWLSKNNFTIKNSMQNSRHSYYMC